MSVLENKAIISRSDFPIGAIRRSLDASIRPETSTNTSNKIIWQLLEPVPYAALISHVVRRGLSRFCGFVEPQNELLRELGSGEAILCNPDTPLELL